ncbi:thermonuclease family protein [Pedobacter sp. UBA4863]|uniref:thermonuclease family protein n=1 Tax=Pedobacter sp. UBA4863 TaxID=1947060 RepID=UPI0025F1E752|nr:thermonuclease family protein [Pedobacter sp. UBA4863]
MGRLIAVFILLLANSVTAQNNNISVKQLQNQTFTAKVIRIIDGDTMEILYQKQPIKIRLAHIDCPEKRKHQPFGTQAKTALSDLCFGQQVIVQSQKTDRYGRLVAVIINAKKQIVNQEMIKQGMAWHFTKYSNDKTYAVLEAKARKQKVGLWQENKPIPPWNWRKAK